MTRRAWLYIRQSQTHEGTISPETQEKHVREWCSSRGLEVVGISRDIDISGLSTANRPGLLEMVAAHKAGKFDLAVADDYSRFSRDMEDGAQIIGSMPVATWAEGEADAGDDFTPLLHMLLAHKFSKDMGKRWKSAHDRRLALGLPPSNGARWGYTGGTKGAEHDGYVQDPLEAPRVHEAYRRYIRGAGFRSIAEWLGGSWQDVTVRQAMDAGFAAGIIRWRGEEHPGAHTPIISEGEWAAYRLARKERAKKGARARAPQWHLSGLVVCGLCEGPMIRVNEYVRCKAYHAKGKTACTGAATRVSVLETRVALWLGGHVEEWAAALPSSEVAVQAAETDVLNCRAVLAQATGLISSLLTRAVTLGLSDAEVSAPLEGLREARDEAQAALDAALAVQAGLATPTDVYGHLEQGGEGLSPEEWNAVLRQVIARVVVAQDKTVTVTAR